MRGRSPSKALYIWLITVLVLSTYPDAMIPDIGIEFSDLVVHFILYFVTGALFFVVFRESRFSALNRAPALVAVALAALYGFGMEVAQYYIPGRSYCLADTAANTLGALAAVILMVQITKRRQPVAQEVDDGG